MITDDITVESSVTQVKIIKQPPGRIKEEILPLELALMPIIQITDRYGRGVAGKTPTVTIVQLFIYQVIS